MTLASNMGMMKKEGSRSPNDRLHGNAILHLSEKTTPTPESLIRTPSPAFCSFISFFLCLCIAVIQCFVSL